MTSAYGPDSAEQLRSTTRSSTSLFLFSEVEVPQIQSSTELNDNLEAGVAHFSDSPARG